MKCKHERIRSINGVVSCADCGEIFPDYFKTLRNMQNQGENTLADSKPGKSPGRKRKAVNQAENSQ